MNRADENTGPTAPAEEINPYKMFVGAFVFWWAGRRQSPGTPGHAFWVEGAEPICAGLISGAALMGIGNAIVNVLL